MAPKVWAAFRWRATGINDRLERVIFEFDFCNLHLDDILEVIKDFIAQGGLSHSVDLIAHLWSSEHEHRLCNSESGSVAHPLLTDLHLTFVFFVLALVAPTLVPAQSLQALELSVAEWAQVDGRRDTFGLLEDNSFVWSFSDEAHRFLRR